MKQLPRRLAALTLALAAVPGSAVAAAHSANPVTPANPNVNVNPAAPAPNPGGPHLDGPRPGGWVLEDVSSPAVRAAADFAVTTLSEIFAHTYVIEEIDSAQSQVASKTDMHLQFRIAQLDDGILGARKDCSAVVFTPAGTQPQQDQLTSFTCQSIASTATVEVPV
jgi:hypothetical protein